MFLINPRVTSNILTNHGVNELLESIDNMIASMAMDQYLNEIYGLNRFIDYDLYDDLCEYREILVDKMIGCNCFTEDDFLLYITSDIQKRLTNFTI